jgi:hypothetical protein
MLRSLRTRVVLAGCAAAFVVTAAAYAAWTSNGTGSGTASAGTASGLTLSAGSPTTLLVPNGSADVATVIANPNAYSVQISTIALDTSQGTNGFSADGGHSGCNLSALSFATQTNASSGWTVGPHGNLTVDMLGALSMSGAALDGCQGATFTVYLTATAASAS